MDRPSENKRTVHNPIVGGPLPYLFFRLAFFVGLANLTKRRKNLGFLRGLDVRVFFL